MGPFGYDSLGEVREDALDVPVAISRGLSRARGDRVHGDRAARSLAAHDLSGERSGVSVADRLLLQRVCRWDMRRYRLLPARGERVRRRRCVLLERVREGRMCGAELSGHRRGVHRPWFMLLRGVQQRHLSSCRLHGRRRHLRHRPRVLLRALRSRRVPRRGDLRADRRLVHRCVRVLYRALRERSERWANVRRCVRSRRRRVHARGGLLLARLLRWRVRRALRRPRRCLHHQRRVLLELLQQAEVRGRPEPPDVPPAG